MLFLRWFGYWTNDPDAEPMPSLQGAGAVHVLDRRYVGRKRFV